MNNKNVGLLKITSRCNDDCKFCIERESISKKTDDLSFEEIKNNYQYLKTNFNLDYLIITGGEPTLHPDFLKIIDFFDKEGVSFKIITNFLNFSSLDFSKKLQLYFSKKKQNRIFGSINDLPVNDFAKRRIIGLENLLKCNLPVMLITVIYKDNLNSLSELILYLHKIFKKHHYKESINFEIRLIYLQDTLNHLINVSIPDNFSKLKKSVQKMVDTASSLGITLTLWNFPFCYLDNVPRFYDIGVKERRKRKLLKISKDHQLNKIEIKDFEKCFKKEKFCQNCKFNDFCSGIEEDYIKKHKFPALSPIK
ncbi:MAG: radical SAM protein [bacterium]